MVKSKKRLLKNYFSNIDNKTSYQNYRIKATTSNLIYYYK